MMLIVIEQFRTHVVRPVLEVLGLWTPAAENLLLGTALHESAGLRYIAQIGGGPALGFYQMEPATLDDLYDNYLAFRLTWRKHIDGFITGSLGRVANLAGNALYATAAARLQYYRVPEALPKADDIDGLARYWKKYWNTELGAGTTEQFTAAYRAAFS